MSLPHRWSMFILIALSALMSVAQSHATEVPPMKIAMIGDSTMSSYAKPPEDKPTLTGWGQVFGSFFNDNVKFSNHAKSGRSSKSFLREGLWEPVLREKPDFVFIQFGHNDQPGKGDRETDPNGDFQDNLRKYIDEARTTGATPVLVTPVARRIFENGRAATTLTPYADAMKKVAAEKKIPLVDLHAASFELFDKLGDAGSADLTASASDRTHFSRKGALVIAKLVADRLPNEVPALRSHLRSASQAMLEKLDLFESGHEGYALYRIPGLVVTAKGTVLAYCEARRTGKSDWDTIDLMLRRSTDGGRTWSPRVKFADVPGPKSKNPVALAQKLANTDDVTYNNPVAFANRDGSVQMLFCLEYCRCFSIRSEDDGLTWSPPVEITATFDKFRPEYDWKVLATGPGHGIQMKSGRLVVPVWLSTGTGGHAHRPSVTSTIFSDDNGQTWQRGEIAVPNTDEWINPNETVVVQLADGRVMLNVRSESKTHRRLVTISPDGATGWSKPRFDEALLEPICMASIIRLSEQPASDKNRIVFANPHNLTRADGKEADGKSRDRKNLSIKLSEDDGQTWPISKVLEPGMSAYCDLAVLSDGTILCLYERGRRNKDDSKPTSYSYLTLTRFNVEWLTNPPVARAIPKRVLLRSSWQTVNIGDIAHTPGMLALLEKHLPDAEVTLWPNKLSDDVIAMLQKRFPKLRFAMTAETQKAALAECDFCLHGSGPGLVGNKTLTTWQATGKPYGFGGVTLNDAELKDHQALLAGAKFVFCRDTQSLDALKASGITGPPMAFGPDATFLLDLRDDAKANAFLREHKLEEKKFACFVPRLRWTPYWKEGRKYAPEELARKDAENQKFQEADHAKMRAAIIAWVRETKLPALLCPEMTYQVELLRPLLFDALPEDVKPHVVVRPSYWLTDEAASTYARAAVVVSFEMHSPIIAIANGTPAIHLRQPTDTRKGQMWRDVGLSDWLFEIDETTGEQIAAKLLALHRDQTGTAATVAKARDFTAARGRQMIEAITAHDWSQQAELDAKLDRTTIAFDGKTPNKLVCDTTLRELPDGSWSLFMLAGDDFEPSPKNYIGLTRSTDAGKSWSPLEPVNIGFPREGTTSGQGPTELLIRDNRCTLFFSTHSQTWGRDWKSWSMHSDDLCRTWSQPKPMPGRLANFTFIRNHIVTRDGRIVIPFQHYLGPGPDVPPPPAEEKPWHGALRHYVSNPRNGVLISSDGGKSWTEHGNIRLTDNDRYHGWAENNLAELSDGRIAMIIRGDRLGGVLYYAESKDGGRTWPEFATKTDIPNPGSKATLYPLGGDTVALLHNPNPSHRSPLALWISFDGLKTWPYRRVLVPESCDGPKGRLNYPDGFVSRDKQFLHFAFDDNRHRAVYYGAKLPPVPSFR